MPPDHVPLERSEKQLTTIWRPRRTALTVLLGLPAVVASAAFTGLMLSIFVPPGAAIATTTGVGVVVAAARVGVWARWVGGRSVAVSPTHLVVCQNGRIVRAFAWTEAASLSVSRGDGPLRTFVDVVADWSDFPTIYMKPKDVWDVRGSFPSVLAVLPGEFERLEDALREACRVADVPFDVGDDR